MGTVVYHAAFGFTTVFLLSRMCLGVFIVYLYHNNVYIVLFT